MSREAQGANALQSVVFDISKGVSRESGEPFFRSLVHRLAIALHADFVLLGELQPCGKKIRVLASYPPSAPDYEYKLAGTPCEGVVRKQLCSYAENVHRLFPLDRSLVEMRAEGYVGTPLIDSGGRCLGLLSALTRKPIADLKLTEAVLQIFADRATVELERENYEAALSKSEQRFRTFSEHATEAVIQFAFDQPVPNELDEKQKLEQIYRVAYVADCNVQAALLFGRQHPDELIGARLHVVLPPTDPGSLQRLLHAMRAPTNVTEAERQFGDRTLLLTRELIVHDGCSWGAWVTGRDITELKKSEARVRQLNAELEHHVAELSKLQAQLELDNSYLRHEIDSNHFLIGSSPRFRELSSRIRMVAPTSATVLISGETGTGKELVARAIHDLSDRRTRPLVKVNCAAISAGLVESELFGHVKGAFTGATERRIGRFEYADGGTLFLDEVTELPLETQAKLLRVLQEQEFEPVGSNRTIKVDVRILTATNRDVDEAVREGRLRRDLYYRLHVVPVEVPPLRDRREDIPSLAEHFVSRYSRQFGREVAGISSSMMKELMAYGWPGNVRELENVLARAIVLCPSGHEGCVLDMPLSEVMPSARAVAAEPPVEDMKEAERVHIKNVLAAAGWVVEGPHGAAVRLGLKPSTLRGRMKRLGLSKP